MAFTEASFENAVLSVFRDTLGYEHLYGPNVARNFSDPLCEEVLLAALRRLNPVLPEVAITKAVEALRGIEDSTLLERNRRFMEYLQNGITVHFYDGEERSALVRLVDFENPGNNSFVVANQWTIIGEDTTKRPDVIVFLNGIPVVVFELKSPSREETEALEAFLQLRNYMLEIPKLFTYNAFLVISDLAVIKAGTLTAGEDRFMEWKTTDGSYENTQYAQYDTLIEGMFEKTRLLDIIKNFICFSGDAKILSGYHQYFAVNKAIESTKRAAQTDGKGGVFWHTQGSGKSLSMVFYARLLIEALDSPTLVVLTDRNDLDDQLYKQFANCSDFLRQQPVRAISREHLKQLLIGRQANGIIFTTMQKFEESADALSERRNIVVMADEAHRGQYGLEERVDPDSGRLILGTARIIRDSLPKATYIGFTGTPISTKDRSTIEVFGDYIDVYDMTQSVEDGATRPVYYESRVIHLRLDPQILELIDAEYEIMSTQSEPYAIEKSKKELSRIESLLGAEETIQALCEDIVKHYEDGRQQHLTGKAMIVAYSRPIGIQIYRKLLELRPEWSEKLGVVMTSSNQDPEEWHPIIGNKNHRDEMAIRFKNDEDPFKIAIVVDMWLTGFDVPSLATMYVYKPMSGANLMQAIARVNRVYKDKEGGLVVDYVGIAGALKQAMNDYTRRDRDNYNNLNIADTALLKFKEKLEVCRDLMHGFDYSEFLSNDEADTLKADAQRANTIIRGANFLLEVDRSETKEQFIKEVLFLKNALSLCRSLVEQHDRFEAAYFEAVRTILTRVSGEGKQLSLREINARINDLLEASIKSEGVINLFSDVESEFSLFDAKFLAQIAEMKEKNLALEILKRLLAEQVSLHKATNLVASEKFSELLSQTMRSYLNGMISNEEVIAELMKLAEEMALGLKEGEKLGLTVEEKAFYDALTRPEAIKDFYENDELVAITRELTDELRRSRTIDWQKKDSARAKMRRMVKKLLKKYNYPPEGLEDAITTVMRQCELFADN